MTQLQPINAQALSKAGKLTFFCMKFPNFKSLRPNKLHLQITSGPEVGHLLEEAESLPRTPCLCQGRQRTHSNGGARCARNAVGQMSCSHHILPPHPSSGTKVERKEWVRKNKSWTKEFGSSSIVFVWLVVCCLTLVWCFL